MADQSIMQRIAQALTGGSGGLTQYADPGYSMCVRETRSMGGTPLTIEQWNQQRSLQAPAQQQVAAPAEPQKPFRF